MSCEDLDTQAVTDAPPPQALNSNRAPSHYTLICDEPI